MEYLQNLQPTMFSFEYNGFNYEGVAVRNYFGDIDDNEIDSTGDYSMILLTPGGTLFTHFYPFVVAERCFNLDIMDEPELLDDLELRRLIKSKIE